MWGNTVAIHSVFFKQNYETKFSTNSIWKKIKSTKTILEKKQKNYVEKHCSNPQCFKEKNYEEKSTKTILKKKINKKNNVGKNFSNT